jgi:glucokinase
MPGTETAIGVDIGGSSTKMGIVTTQGEILRRAEQLTPQHLPGEMILESISEKLAGLVSWAKEAGLSPQGIGVSVCGYLSANGEEPDYINLHALDHFPILRHFQERFGLPVVMDNDMNCGALGEYLFGGGRRTQRLMVMTVATGIGMAVILDGVVFRQSAGTTGNPGHIILAPDGPTCVAGCRGCLESLASAGPIARRAENLARSQRSKWLAAVLAKKGALNPEDLFHAAEAGDLAAQEAWVETGNWLGRGLASWVEIFTPQVVIVGGGIAQAGHWLIDPIEREMRRTGEPYFTRRVRTVKQSQLGRDIAMLGAASFYLYPQYAPRWKPEKRT